MAKPAAPSAGRLAKDIMIYGLGDAILRGLAVVTVPIFTRFFHPADYGLISLLVAFMSLFGLMHDAGMASAAQRQYFDHIHTNKAAGRRATATAFWFVFGWGLVLVVLGLLLGEELAQLLLKDRSLEPLVWLVIGTSFLAVLAQLARSFFRLTFRPWPFALTALLSGILMVGLSLWFVLDGHGIAGYFWGGLLGILPGALLTFVLARDFLRARPELPVLKQMLVYGLPLVPAALSGFVFDLSDRFFLARIRDFHEVGLYAVAYSIVSLMALFIGAFAQAWAPFALAHHAEKPHDAPQLFARFSLYIVIVFSFLSLGVTIFGREILALLTTPEFFDAARVIPVLALAYVAFATTQVTTLGMSIARKTSLIAVGAGLAAVINLVGNILLIPEWGMLGAAWATLVAYILLTLFYGVLSQRYLPCPWPWPKLIVVFALAGGLMLGGTTLPEGLSFSPFAIQIGYLFIFPVSLWVFRILNRDEWTVIRRIVLFDLAFWKRHGGVPEDLSM